MEPEEEEKMMMKKKRARRAEYLGKLRIHYRIGIHNGHIT